MQGGGGDVGFLPDPDAPSLGYVLAAPREGGLDFFNLDGELVTRHAGARLSSFAVAPGFELRGESLPLIFGASPENGQVYGYAVVRAGARVLDLPLASIEAADGVSGICLLREGAGYVDLVILGNGASAEIWRVRDSGEDALSVESLRQFALPNAARQCDAFDNEIYTLSPAGGLTRLDANGTLLAQGEVNASSITVAEFSGSRLVLATNGSDDTLMSFDARTLDRHFDIDVIDGLSTPGIERPGALDASMANFGFTAYANGMVAVFDQADQRLKVISRDAFSRAVITGEAPSAD